MQLGLLAGDILEVGSVGISKSPDAQFVGRFLLSQSCDADGTDQQQHAEEHGKNPLLHGDIPSCFDILSALSGVTNSYKRLLTFFIHNVIFIFIIEKMC